MDVFYCGSIQSLGAMMLPLALVLLFSPYSSGGFGDDGGGRRAVLTASTKDPKDFIVIFLLLGSFV
jgi:ascorbate-specific PTS system EIIC-type component UlaA